jgi:hypothetical protein
MKITAEELKRAYHDMSDQELLSINRDELTEVGRNCLDAEIAERGIELQMDGEPGPAVDQGAQEACAGAFRFPDEAQLVQGLLESAGIPARLDNHLGDLFWMGSTAFQSSRVFVPAAMLNDAQSIIESHAAEEELAAQVEADSPPAVVLARYEKGTFKPIDPIDLEEGTEVEVHLPKKD